MLKSHFPYAAAAFAVATLLAGNGALFVITVAAALAFIPIIYSDDDDGDRIDHHSWRDH